MPRSLRGSCTSRAPVPCPYCGRALPVWAENAASAHGLWVKCKNPACKREVEIKL
nr:MAG TPA: cysteine-rich protein [Caudoviricetes sp.]